MMRLVLRMIAWALNSLLGERILLEGVRLRKRSRHPCISALYPWSFELQC
jgi:hypothetical protein